MGWLNKIDLTEPRMVKKVAWGALVLVIGLSVYLAADLSIGFREFDIVSLIVVLYSLLFVCLLGTVLIKPVARLNPHFAIIKFIVTLFLYVFPAILFLMLLLYFHSQFAGLD